jgi:hypothetical protein
VTLWVVVRYFDWSDMEAGPLKVRCPECGRRYRANVERKPDSKGLHRVQASCPCGRVRAEGSVQMCFFREAAS